MFKSTNKLSINDLRKKINWKLQGNFFTLTNAQKLSQRKLRKVLKLICQIEGFKLNRKELKNLALFIKTDFEKEHKIATRVWAFVADLFLTKTDESENIEVLSSQIFPSSYLESRFEQMII